MAGQASDLEKFKNKQMKNTSALRLTAFLLLSVAAGSLQAQNQPLVIDEVVAVVGGKPVLASDIETQYLQFRMQGNIKGSATETRCAILEGILYNKLLLNQAEIDSVTVSEKQIENELDRRIRYFISQIGSKEKLEEYYKKSLFEIKEEFRGIIEDQMRVEMTQSNITKDVKITPSEIRKFFKELPQDSIPMVNSEYIIGQIVKKPKVGLAEEIAVKEKLRALRKRILDGENFATLAVLYSEDPGSAAKGGEVGLFGRGELYPEYEAIAFKLKENEVSDIVKTKAGYHIIQLIERRGDYVNTRHILLVPKVSPVEMAKASAELDSIAQLIDQGKLTFDQAVEKFSDDPNKINGGLMINPATQNTRWEPDQLDPKVFYVVDKLNVGQISRPMQFKTDEEKDAYRILYLKDRTRPHRANMTDDYDRLQSWALDRKKNEVIRNWMTDKISSTYIRINPEFQKCKFEQNWIK